MVAKILGHTVKGLTKTLGESKFYESTTSLYIHINPEKERIAIESYHETVGGMQVLQSQLQAAGSALGRAKIIRFC